MGQRGEGIGCPTPRRSRRSARSRNREIKQHRVRPAAQRDRRWPDMTPARSPGDIVSALQARRRSRPSGWTTQEDLHDIDRALAEHPASAELWMLRGDFILLCDDADDTTPLEEALRSYKTAADLAPTRPEPQLEIGHYMDSVADDPAGAIPFFERAIALGGGQEARDALQAAKQQLGD